MLRHPGASLVIAIALAALVDAFHSSSPAFPSPSRFHRPIFPSTRSRGFDSSSNFINFASGTGDASIAPPAQPPISTGGSGNEGSGEGEGDKPKNPLASLWNGYNELLEAHPIQTKALTSFVGFAIGDILAQKYLNKGQPFDYARLARLASFGLLIHGPTGHFFYGFLDSKIPGTGVVDVATKVGIDQILWNPVFGCMFFGYMGLASGDNLGEIFNRIKRDLLTSVKGSWTVWPFAHAINFAFIPNSQRLLYINSIQIGYNMFLSVIANR